MAESSFTWNRLKTTLERLKNSTVIPLSSENEEVPAEKMPVQVGWNREKTRPLQQ